MRSPISAPGSRSSPPGNTGLLLADDDAPDMSLVRELHITGWRPLASRDTVHHMMVIGCEAPVTGVETNLWNCGGSLAEAGLESPGTTCPGSAASQVSYVINCVLDFNLKLDNVEFR